MKRYVCGFLFSPDRARVLLIRKNRPAWQAGRLNGIGGKIEPGEAPLDAMRREFREEASLDLRDWQQVLTLDGDDDDRSGVGWEAHFFRGFGDLDAAVARTDEPLEIHPVRPLPLDVIANLHWIVPLLLDEDVHGRAYRVRVNRAAPRSPAE